MASLPVAMLVVAVLAGCTTHSPLGVPAPPSIRAAPFVVVGDQGAGVSRRVAATPEGVARCMLTAKCEVNVLQREEHLEVVVPVAWIAVTRNTNKQWDDFHLHVEAGGVPVSRGLMPTTISGSATFALSGTVDTTAAPLTTWQRQDTLRMSLPWPDTIGPETPLLRTVPRGRQCRYARYLRCDLQQ